MGDAKGTKRQVKSKQRVADHGEVFTADREVNAMLDLVKQETERIDSRFLEPACGDGNFLAEILRRKLSVVKNRYRKSALDYERFSILALTSIYGVDILQDNVLECRQRLFNIWNEHYTKAVKQAANEEARCAARFILKRNILCGDALSLKAKDGTPIIFSEWSFIVSDLVKRRDFRLDVLMNENPDQTHYQAQISLFAEDVNGMDNWEIDPETHRPTPKPVREYPPTDYRRLIQYDE
jgi:hypothetical protein